MGDDCFHENELGPSVACAAPENTGCYYVTIGMYLQWDSVKILEFFCQAFLREINFSKI